MNKRVLIAGLAGGIAMYAWTFVAHMLLPLGEAGVRQIDKEQALLATMQTTLGEQGFYLFPSMDSPNDQAAYQKKIASGPSGVLVYFPKRDFSFGQLLGVEFGSELLQALIVAYLVSLAHIGSFGGRVGFYAMAGLVAAIGTNVSYWNWYGFPLVYTAAYMFTTWMAYVCAGLAASSRKIWGRGVGEGSFGKPVGVAAG